MERDKWSHIADHVNALGVRILEALDLLGARHRPVRLRTLMRKMNGHKQPLWGQALNRLHVKKYIAMAPGPRRQKLISLVEVPEYLQPRTVVRKPRRRRKPSDWFKQRLPEFLRRDGYDGKAEEVEAGLWEGYQRGHLSYFAWLRGCLASDGLLPR